MDKFSILLFAKTISGHFSNKKQAIENPHHYPNINIYFIPICLSIFEWPAFYSEQSYDHAPWSPYRQAIHKFCWDKDKFILENYKIDNQERIAGGGFNTKLLNNIKSQSIIQRNGCTMHFKKKESEGYIGELEPGNKCKIKKAGKITYIKSSVILTSKKWISEDSGFDIRTYEKVWGSSYGPHKFLKLSSFRVNFNKAWSNKITNHL